jgi:hypothetical protein
MAGCVLEVIANDILVRCSALQHSLPSHIYSSVDKDSMVPKAIRRNQAYIEGGRVLKGCEWCGMLKESSRSQTIIV